MPQHIVFALSSFYPDHRAGTETYVLNLSKELIKAGYQVSVITPAVGKTSSKYTYEGISVYTFSVPLKVSTRELNGLVKPSGLDEFRQLLKQLKPDIFHLHSLSRSMHAVHVKIADELGIKTFFTAHLGSIFCVKGDLMLFGKEQCNGMVIKQRCLACFIHEKKKFSATKSRLAAWFINRFIVKSPLIKKIPALNIVSNKINQLQLLKNHSDLNIAIAPWLESVFRLNGLEKTSLILQGISNEFLARDTNNKGIFGKINLIFTGRMHPDKGVHLLLEALENNLTSSFNLTIVTIPFADETAYYHSIKTKFQQLGYTDWFEKLKQEEVSNQLNDAHVLVLPSTRNEAAPLVILEAFAQKVPVIGSDYIAIQEMVQHNVNGLLFKNGDAQSLKSQLLRLVDEPELLPRLKQNFGPLRSFEEVAREHDKVFLIICGQG